MADELIRQQLWLTMSDGVRLSATLVRPRTTRPVPVLLEMLPYRKDDMFYARDVPIHQYFARHGYAALKVDVRGTGSSEGCLPAHEYSDREIQDGVEVLEQVSRMPWCNGRSGMFGISWGGFNAIQVAMRRPPSLKAILAVDASDDLFSDDIHYLDGCLHYDEYHLAINRENALPAPPHYRLTAAYWRDRFEREPWFFEVLRHQGDGPFWRDRSLRYHPERLEVPAYLIGGLLDGYRDSPMRMRQMLRQPVQVEIGPWNHAWPDNGQPGPNYEWRRRSLAWWDAWLKDGPAVPADAIVFLRDGRAGGRWVRPRPAPARRYQVGLSGDGYLLRPRLGLAEAAPDGHSRLAYRPGRGVGAGLWWGDPTGDVAGDAAGALVFDAEPVSEPLEVVGYAPFTVRAALDTAAWANLSVRLEDVAPDGRVELVTGALINGSQRFDRLRPQPLCPNRFEDWRGQLHYTTWTFQPGHRIRLSISNAQFPMAWPSPFPLTMTVQHSGTWLELPLAGAPATVADLPPPEPREEPADAIELPSRGWPYLFQSRPGRVEWRGDQAIRVKNRVIRLEQRMTYTTSDDRPWQSAFAGQTWQQIELPGRQVRLEADLHVRSDQTTFHAFYARRLWENGRLVRRARWRDHFPRRFH